MKLRQIGSNQTEIVTNLQKTALADFPTEYTILFSYQTPVAVFVSGVGSFRTNKKWSVTTSRHINKWLADNALNGAPIDQSVLDSLIEEGK